MPSTTAARPKSGNLPLSPEKSSPTKDSSAANSTVKRAVPNAYTITDSFVDGSESFSNTSGLIMSASGKLSDDPFNEADEDDVDDPDVSLTPACPSNPLFSFITSAFLSACWEIIALAVPLMLGFIAQAAASVVNLAFVGHLGEDELAASSLAILFCNVTGVSPVVGLLSTMDTLGSQAYGARNFKRVGVILQRGIAIATVQVLPFIVIWCFSEPLLELVGISPSIASMASRYIIVTIAALPATAYTSALQRYLEVQGCTRPIMISTVVSVGALVGFNVLFINVIKVGYIGVAYSTVISQYLTFLTLFAYIYFTGFYKLTWGGWSRDALRGWGEYIRIGLPGAGMICAEWWGFEIHTLVSARLGTSALAAQSIVVQLNALLFTVPQATGIAAAALVGRALGANRPVAARVYATAALVLSALGQFIIGGVMAVTREQIGRIFTNEEKVLEIASSALFIVSGFIIFDGLQGTASGVLRGAGRQIIGFYVNILGYWIFAMPVSIALAFHVGHWNKPADEDYPASREKGLGVIGQWITLAAASAMATLLMVGFILRLRWPDLASEVNARELKHRAEAAAAEEAAAEAEAEAAGVKVSSERDAGGYRPPAIQGQGNGLTSMQAHRQPAAVMSADAEDEELSRSTNNAHTHAHAHGHAHSRTGAGVGPGLGSASGVGLLDEAAQDSAAASAAAVGTGAAGKGVGSGKKGRGKVRSSDD